jgi:hypothetical protein
LKIFVDFGYGFLKAMDEKGSVILFPSVAGEMQEVSFSLSDNNTGLGITTDNGSWLFGQSAIEQSTLGSHQQNVDWILSDEYKAGVLLAITQLTKASRVDVELTLALPYETTERKELVKQLITNLRGEHIVKPIDSNRQHINLSFPQKFPIVPQNVSPVLRHMIDRFGNIRLPETLSDVLYIGLCNGGSHTVELSTCRIIPATNGFRALAGKSEAIGTYALSEVVRPILQQQFPDESPLLKKDHKLFEVMTTGEFRPYNQIYDVSEVIAKPKDQYCQTIINLCNNVWSNITAIKKPELYGFIASGGGANIFVDYLRRWHPNVQVSDNPQLDVCVGMQRLRKMLDKEQ